MLGKGGRAQCEAIYRTITQSGRPLRVPKSIHPRQEHMVGVSNLALKVSACDPRPTSLTPGPEPWKSSTNSFDCRISAPQHLNSENLSYANLEATFHDGMIAWLSKEPKSSQSQRSFRAEYYTRYSIAAHWAKLACPVCLCVIDCLGDINPSRHHATYPSRYSRGRRQKRKKKKSYPVCGMFDFARALIARGIYGGGAY